MERVENYKYLFPYEKIPCNSKVVIYGAGIMGQNYLMQLLINNYCKVIALADKNFSEYKNMVVPVCDPKNIHVFDFDYVIIAVRSKLHLNELYDVLAEQGIKENKIIYTGEINRSPSLVKCEIEDELSDGNILGNVSVNLMGGIGDYVVQKKFIEMLTEYDANIRLDVFCSSNVEFLKFLYSDMKQINNLVYNCGYKYQASMQKYDAAITMVGTGLFVKIDRLSKDYHSINDELYYILKKAKSITDELDCDITKPLFNDYYRSIYRGENCIRRLGLKGTVPIKNEMVHIPEGDNSTCALGSEFGKYITLNFGNGTTHNAMRVSKVWPKEYFEELIMRFRRRFGRLKIVQIGPKDADRLCGVDKCVFGRDFSFVSNVLRNSILHIDIESGLVHLATHIGTKCLVLFGPTQIEYLGYKQNINVQAGDCHGCFGLYSDPYVCAKGLKKARCMYSITPQIVMNKVEEYMQQIGKVGG